MNYILDVKFRNLIKKEFEGAPYTIIPDKALSPIFGDAVVAGVVEGEKDIKNLSYQRTITLDIGRMILKFKNGGYVLIDPNNNHHWQDPGLTVTGLHVPEDQVRGY